MTALTLALKIADFIRAPKFEATPSAKTRAVAPGENQCSAGGKRFFFALHRNFLEIL
jgi:hypothetical protein